MTNINLADRRIGAEGASALADTLNESSSVTIIDFRSNEIVTFVQHVAPPPPPAS
jgi:hypothetical protein